MESIVRLSRPDVDASDIESVAQTIQGEHLVAGEQARRVESWMRNFLGVEHCVAVSSGTAALHLALLAHGVGPGDEVVLPAWSFVATANVVELCGAKPVFVDVRSDRPTLDTNAVAEQLTDHTRVVLPVHEFGYGSDLEALKVHTSSKGVSIVEDAACALGSVVNGRPLGSIGDTSCFSFHPRKVATSGEGGALCTNSEVIADTVRNLHNHGLTLGASSYDVVRPGFNFRLSDIHAALLIGQLLRLKSILERRRSIAEVYLSEIRNPRVLLPEAGLIPHLNWQTFFVVMNQTGMRDALARHLRDRGIESSLGAQFLPGLRYYRDHYGLESAAFPNALRLSTHGLALPLHGKMLESEVARVVEAVNSFDAS